MSSRFSIRQEYAFLMRWILIAIFNEKNIYKFSFFLFLFEHMQTILDKVFLGDSYNACERILETYYKQDFCIVNYIYFANIAGKKLFKTYKLDSDPGAFKNLLLAGYKRFSLDKINGIYKQALIDWDLLLPDGIALQIYYYLARKKWLENLNGTDFAPFFLDYLKYNLWTDKFNVILYGTYKHLLDKTKDFLQDKWYNVIYAQDGYSKFDWNQLENIFKSTTTEDGVNPEISRAGNSDCVNILLVARATPVYPIQEIWTYANINLIKKNKLIVMNQAWTFDRWVGEQKRPPKFIRKVRLEWLWRLITDPKRNFKKVWNTLSLPKYIIRYLLLKKK